MASDGRTANRFAQKVYALSNAPLVWTASGSVYVIEEVAAVLRDLDEKVTTDQALKQAFLTPNTQVVRQVLYQNVHAQIKRCYANALPFGNQQQQAGQHPFRTDFLFLGVGQEGPYLLEIAGDGQANWHTDSGFYAIGSGGDFATVARGLMSHYLDGDPLPLDLGKKVAFRAIETTCEVSSAFVGGDVQLAVVGLGAGPQRLAWEELEDLKEAVAGWKQVERESLSGEVAEPTTDDLDALPDLAAGATGQRD